MSYNKSIDSSAINSDLTSVANAIRAKSGGTGQLAFPAGFISEINNIPAGGSAIAELVKANCVVSCDSSGTYTGDTHIALPRAATAKDCYFFKIISGSPTANACSSGYTRTGTTSTSAAGTAGYSNRQARQYCIFSFATSAGNMYITPTSGAGTVVNNTAGSYTGDLYVIHMGEFDEA